VVVISVTAESNVKEKKKGKERSQCSIYWANRAPGKSRRKKKRSLSGEITSCGGKKGEKKKSESYFHRSHYWKQSVEGRKKKGRPSLTRITNQKGGTTQHFTLLSPMGGKYPRRINNQSRGGGYLGDIRKDKCFDIS